MQNLKQVKWILLVIISSLLISGCGFQPRRASSIPPQLRHLDIQTSKPYSEFITELSELLTSLDIQLSVNKKEAPYTLQVLNINYSQSNPPITTTSLAVTLTYTLSVNVRLIDRQNKNIIRKTLITASRSIAQNPSQVYTPGTATVIKQELRRDVTSKIYYLLIANNTRNALNHAP